MRLYDPSNIGIFDIFGSHQKYLVDTSGPVKFYLILLGESEKLRMDPPRIQHVQVTPLGMDAANFYWKPAMKDLF